MRENPPFLMELSRIFDASCERVFAAITDPKCVTAWWAPRGWYTPYVEMDVRVGGRYRLGMRSEDDPALMIVHGEYLIVEPPKQLVFTYIWEAEGAGAKWVEFDLANLRTTVTINLRDLGGKTELTIRHDGFPTENGRDQHRLGWSSNWDCLEEFLLRHVVKARPAGEGGGPRVEKSAFRME